ncbi:MAG: hypothetical protein WBP61_14425 [Nocardioides sp.]
MTAPIPEEQDQPPVEADDPPGEHRSELPDESSGSSDSEEQQENAATSLDEPSDGVG